MESRAALLEFKMASGVVIDVNEGTGQVVEECGLRPRTTAQPLKQCDSQLDILI